MNTVDWVLLALAGLFAWAGWRQGLIKGALSMLGFLGGALLAVAIVPALITRFNLPVMVRGAVSIAVVIGVAVLGQALANWLGRSIRDRWRWRPAELLDSLGGAVFYVVALALVAWVVASTVAVLPATSISGQVRSSTVLGSIDTAVPPQAVVLMGRLQTMLNASGFPQAFDALAEPMPLPVEPPDSTVAGTPKLRKALRSVVRVSGLAPGCGEQITGSGFVYAKGRVMTNAHVVAGVENPVVEVPGGDEPLDATVVYFDPSLDIAVLKVANLAVAPLAFGPDAETGDDAVVAGYPGGGSEKAEPARIRNRVSARGQNIYGSGRVVRDIYSVRSKVLPGDSGGPLLAPNGTVYGVIFAAALNDSSTGYALTSDQVRGAAAEGKASSAPVGVGQCLAPAS